MRTHDDPPLEYHPSEAGKTPLVVEMMKLEGLFPPEGCVDVAVRMHDDLPVVVYSVALSEEDWGRLKRAFDSMTKVER